MPHRIDTAQIADKKAGKEEVKKAVTRMQQIEAQAPTATTAQLKAAIGDLAKYIRQIVRVIG